MTSSKSSWWPCPNPLCKGWEFVSGRATCRRCNALHPAWCKSLPGGTKPNHAGTVQDGQGFIFVPRSKAQRRKASRAARQMQAQQNGASTDPNLPNSELPAARPQQSALPQNSDVVESSQKDSLALKVRKLEETQKVLGGTGTPALLAELENELQQSRALLRASAPTPKRLQGLQSGIERRQEKVSKLEEKRVELQTSLESLEPHMMRELEQIRAQYMARRKDMELQLEQNQLHWDTAKEELQELTEQRALLVAPQVDESGLPTEDMTAFRRVLAHLVHTLPDYQQVFKEVQSVAQECVEGVPRQPRAALVRAYDGLPAKELPAKRQRESGAGISDTPTPMDEEDTFEEGELVANWPAGTASGSTHLGGNGSSVASTQLADTPA
eukprot:2591807-Amphidinium_carterae.2